MTNTKTKIALAAAMLVGATSLAAAQGFDPNLANRYPAYANPVAAAPQAHVSVHQNRTLQSAPVGLYNGRANYENRGVALRNAPVRGQDWFAVDENDRASSPYAGGGF